MQDGESLIKVAVNISYTEKPNYRTADQDSEVDTMTRCGLKVTGFELRWEQEIFPSPHTSPDGPCGPPRVLYHGYRGSFPRGKAAEA
jgi:hypothetical protein